MAVEPVTSQKTTVTVLRTSWRPGGVSGAAHAGQKAKSSGDSRPQLAQVSTGGAYATGFLRTRGCRTTSNEGTRAVPTWFRTCAGLRGPRGCQMARPTGFDPAISALTGR